MSTGAISSRCSVAGGSVADRSARTAAGAEAAAHWRPYEPDRGRSRRTVPHRGVRTGAAGIGLDGRRQHADGHPLGWRRFDRFRRYAAELVALSPDVIVATAGSIVGALQQASRTVPIVFVTTIDPVGGGLVASLARPGGNATGFTTSEFSMFGKWLELLKEIAPGVTRVAIIRDPSVPAGFGQFAAIQTVAPSLRVELTPVDVRDGDEIEHAITAFARSSNGGLIVAGAHISVVTHRDLIVTLAARHRLPAVYSYPTSITGGGLISYGADQIDQYRRAAGYVDRILKGEKPADLPVQAPTKFELVINLKTAKALGSKCRRTLLARADEVIE